VLGIKTEMGLAQLMRENKSLLKFGINLEVRCARVHVNEYLQRNNDNRERLKRFPSSNHSSHWGTGVRGLMRGMATLPKVTRSY